MGGAVLKVCLLWEDHSWRRDFVPPTTHNNTDWYNIMTFYILYLTLYCLSKHLMMGFKYNRKDEIQSLQYVTSISKSDNIP